MFSKIVVESVYLYSHLIDLDFHYSSLVSFQYSKTLFLMLFGGFYNLGELLIFNLIISLRLLNFIKK